MAKLSQYLILLVVAAAAGLAYADEIDFYDDFDSDIFDDDDLMIDDDELDGMFNKLFDEIHDEFDIPKDEPEDTRKHRLSSFAKFARLAKKVNKDTNLPFECEPNFMSMLLDEEKRTHFGLDATKIRRDMESLRRVRRGADQSMPFVGFNNAGIKAQQSAYFGERAIAPAKDQKSCGSCWTFAAIGALEVEMFLVSGKKISLSEQQILDCAVPSSNGCNGGNPVTGYKYIFKNGIASQSEAPYLAKDQAMAAANKDDFCQEKYKNKNAFKGDDYKVSFVQSEEVYSSYEQYNHQDFKDRVMKAATEHALVVFIYASPLFQIYKSGVLVDTTAAGKAVDHGVVMVGYGSERANGKGINYWVIRNSWGPTWGKNGNIYVSRDVEKHISMHDWIVVPKLKCEGKGCKKQKAGDVITKPDAAGADVASCNAKSGLTRCKSKNNECIHCHMCPECKDGSHVV